MSVLFVGIKKSLYFCGVLVQYYTNIKPCLMIDISQITYSYGRRKAPVFADFSLSLAPGHVYGLLGKNGTGKSTLLYLMCGLLRAQSGSIQFEGIDVRKRLPEVLREVFLVSEEFDLPNVSLERYVHMNAPFYPRFDERILRDCLEMFGLSADISLASLSMGQKKKVFMSFALAANTRLLLMDEPTNGLDIPSKNIFRKVVARCLTDERTLVISTHQVRDIDMLLDHVVMLEGSRLLLNRSTADICRALRFEERPIGASTADALFVQPSIQGNAVIVPNGAPDIETPLNLELLFNCAEAGKLPPSLLA